MKFQQTKDLVCIGGLNNTAHIFLPQELISYFKGKDKDAQSTLFITASTLRLSEFKEREIRNAPCLSKNIFYKYGARKILKNTKDINYELLSHYTSIGIEQYNHWLSGATIKRQLKKRLELYIQYFIEEC